MQKVELLRTSIIHLNRLIYRLSRINVNGRLPGSNPHIVQTHISVKTNVGKIFLQVINPVDIYLLKGNNRSTITRCEICLKLTIKTPERRK